MQGTYGASLVPSLKYFQHALLCSDEIPTHTHVCIHIYTLHITHILPFEEELFWLHSGECRFWLKEVISQLLANLHYLIIPSSDKKIS